MIVRGVSGARLPGIANMTLRPSADGQEIAAFGNARVELWSAGGRLLWQAAAWGTTDVGWTASGELVARSPGGLAKLDLETGELGDRACGWAFGLSETAFESGASGASGAAEVVCDVAR